MEPTFATHWFYRNLTQSHIVPGARLCCVCGMATNDHVPKNKVLRPTFTDYDVLRIRTGVYVCPACAWYFDNQDLRRRGWWLTRDRAQPVDKAQWLPVLAQHLIAGAPADSYYLIKPSGPQGKEQKMPGIAGKHLALLAPLTCSGSRTLRIQFDTITLDLDLSFLDLIQACFSLRQCHSWREIRNDDYISKYVNQRWRTVSEFMDLRSRVRPWLNTAHIDLAQYVWTKEE